MPQISPLMFFSSEKELFSWTYLLNKTPWRTKILISRTWNRILKIWDKIFELIKIEVQCNKNYFKIILPQEAGAAKTTPKIDKVCILYIYREYLLCLESNAAGSFLAKIFLTKIFSLSRSQCEMNGMISSLHIFIRISLTCLAFRWNISSWEYQFSWFWQDL